MVVDNAAVTAVLSGLPPAAAPPLSSRPGQMLIAGQDLVGNQVVAARATTVPPAPAVTPGRKERGTGRLAEAMADRFAHLSLSGRLRHSPPRSPPRPPRTEDGRHHDRNRPLRVRVGWLGSVVMAKRVLLAMVTLMTVMAVPAGAEALPVSAGPQWSNGAATQLVTVRASSASATTASLTALSLVGGTWVRALGPFEAYVGKDGIGEASEYVSRTPAGVWTLTEAFGIQANNGTKLPYRQVDTSDWWVSDVNSPYYNMPYRCAPATCPFDESASENLGKVGAVYNHATVIDYNRSPAVPGRGSAFFLHVSNGRPTAGCVSLASGDLDAVMRWLDPANHPVIDIAVGAPARKVVRRSW
jgi:L,D-peptidoglycan transpeptidase YkuD (ErfK/YbiS/YcfS/YnhG family)